MGSENYEAFDKDIDPDYHLLDLQVFPSLPASRLAGASLLLFSRFEDYYQRYERIR
jgi:hypothetical protein